MMTLEATVLKIKERQRPDLVDMRVLLAAKYPMAIAALKTIDFERSKPKRRKGFNLVKRESKKYGIRYYVRYSHNGKMLPTKWNTHTGDEAAAEQYAIENKTRLVERYLREKDGKARMYSIIETFYRGNPDTKAFIRHISEERVKVLGSFINNYFLPFLRQKEISCFTRITKTVIFDFQDYLLSRGIKPQTLNNKMAAVKNILTYAVRKGMIDKTPCEGIESVPVQKQDKNVRGCYELDILKGVFNESWSADESLEYILNLLIYTTGMRNGEIKRLRQDDIIEINDCRFIRINDSKTASGKRNVPLHDFVYEKLMSWAAGRNIGQNFFKIGCTRKFQEANICLGRKLGYTEERLEAENITYYSGRHFFKTLMSSEGLGDDIEEVFMGHKVSANVAKLYNHRDKVGQERIAKKAKQVFSILDRCLFVKKR